MNEPFEQVIELGQSELLDFCGRNDQKLRELESQFKIRIIPRGNTLKLIGPPDEVSRARQLIDSLLGFSRCKNGLNKQQVRYAIESVKSDKREDLQSIFSDKVAVPLRRRAITPITGGQKHYLDAIRRSDVVFGIGPAGTGKTYLAMAMAVNYLVSNYVSRIVLVRPAVEAGEKLGFLPGDIAQKFDPYVRPLYDALNDMIDPDRVKQYLENGTVEIAPLAFMRGRTLNSAFVILDEGQNTSIEQMKMFLTRLGHDSKAVITGDITQVDLPEGKVSGLVHVQSVLRGLQGIDFIYFSERDVVRHRLVQEIVRAYERAEHAVMATTQEELPFETEQEIADSPGAGVEALASLPTSAMATGENADANPQTPQILQPR